MNDKEIENIKNGILKIVKKLDPTIDIKEINIEDEANFTRFNLVVSREQYVLARKLIWSDDFYCQKYKLSEESFLINVKEQVSLIHAKIGDYVLIHTDLFFRSDEESHVGIVSSIRMKNNNPLYGVKVFVPCKGGVEFEHLSNEEYTGYHTGFLKILTKQEAKKHFLKQIVKYQKEKLNQIKKLFSKKETNERVNNIFESIGNMEIVNVLQEKIK
jgi:hypothetical protein